MVLVLESGGEQDGKNQKNLIEFFLSKFIYDI